MLLASTSALGAGKKSAVPDFGQLAVSGYVHVQWVSDFRVGTYPAHTFDLRRVRLKFHYIPSDIGACVELGCDRLVPSIEDAFVQYRVLPVLQFVAGLRKTPFSREELTPASRLLMIERGMTNDAFGDYGYLGRDIGLAVEGELPGKRLGYAAGVFNGNRARLSRDGNNAKQFSERLTARPADWLTLGLSGTQRNDSVTGTPVSAYGADFSCVLRRWTVEGEALTGSSEPGTRMLGAWVTGACRLGTFEPGVRLERLYPDLSAADNSETELTLACNWYPHRRVQVKANLVTEMIRGTLGHELIAQAQVSF